MPELVVAGWTGAGNVGDELLFEVVRGALAARGVAVTAVAVDPAEVEREHGVATLDRLRYDLLVRRLRRADGLLFGPGGLLQDDSSALSLPSHLARPWLARRLGRPVLGFGLGAGPLRRPSARWALRAALRGVRLVVRDPWSAHLLRQAGLTAVVESSDLVFAREPSVAAQADRIVVSLRPYRSGRLLPAATAAGESELAELAAGLDALATATGLPLHFVAFEPERDRPFHDAIAARLRATVTSVDAQTATVADEIASSRLVVAMRFHAGVLAALAARPAVLIGYAPKVEALAAETGMPLLRHDPGAYSGLAEAAARAGAVRGREGSRDRLRSQTRSAFVELDRFVERVVG